MSPTTTRSPVPDQVCADAADLARQAVEEVTGPGQVGPHLGVVADGDRVVSHLFACQDPAYAGWRWEVTVARASRARTVTVSESQLLPGPDSLLAPAWVPWSERVRPGDLGVGDLMPTSPDDERLVPVVAIDGDDGLIDWDDSRAWGASPAGDSPADAPLPGSDDAPPATPERRAADVLGPARVLSAAGRETAASRWYSGSGGASTAQALAAPAQCLTCGFFVRLNGPLGRMFGVCANEYAPDDGRVVSVDHGCGAHSDPELPAGPGFRSPLPAIDEIGYDLTAGPDVSLPDSVFDELDPDLP